VATTHSTEAAAEDLSLIQRIGVQDDEAFEILYQRYASRLGSFLFPLLQDTTLVDEVINATMFVVWRKAAQFRPSTRLSTWLFGIARHKALKALKTSTLQSSELLVTSLTEHGAVGPEALFLQQEQIHMVTQALRTLPSQLREVVEGVYYHTLTYAELATRLGCPISTVKSRLDSARRHLVMQLRQVQYTPAGQSRRDGHECRTRLYTIPSR
jgi:RNA polymerase sigma-70 factor (ECF subfamily)